MFLEISKFKKKILTLPLITYCKIILKKRKRNLQLSQWKKKCYIIFFYNSLLQQFVVIGYALRSTSRQNLNNNFQTKIVYIPLLRLKRKAKNNYVARENTTNDKYILEKETCTHTRQYR